MSPKTSTPAKKLSLDEVLKIAENIHYVTYLGDGWMEGRFGRVILEVEGNPKKVITVKTYLRTSYPTKFKRYSLGKYRIDTRTNESARRIIDRFYGERELKYESEHTDIGTRKSALEYARSLLTKTAHW